MLKKIIVTAIVSSLIARGLGALLQRAGARKREQEIDVQRWEDEGGQPATTVTPDAVGTEYASALRAQSAS